jgi:hypothetical protein
MFSRTLSAILILAAVNVMAAQEMPAMSPEVRRLSYFLGRWQLETVTAQGQGTAGTSEKPVITIQDAEWLDGTWFLLVRRVEGTTPAGSAKLSVIGYDPRAQSYAADFFIPPDVRLSMTGLVTGSHWTWLSRDGQLRYTIQVLSPSTYTFQFARSRGAVGWQTLAEGKAVKIREAPAAPVR